MQKIGFIGSGEMAGAIIKGLIKSGFTNAYSILATQSKEEGLEEKSQKLGIEIITDNKILVQKSDIIFIATKPNQVKHILEEISSFITDEKLIVSIAAGIKVSTIEKALPPKTKIIRIMPNTPIFVNEGMCGIYGGDYATAKDITYIKSVLDSFGKYIVVEKESDLDIVTAISGSGPAFFYKIINDIALAGEKLGLEYEKSLLLSIQTAIGSAKMALARENTMEKLISNVATKGGCTRVGVETMKEYNTEKLFYNIIKNTSEKAQQLGNID